MRLRPVEEGDLLLFLEWLNDPEVRYWLSLSEAPPLTMKDEEEWYERTRGSEGDLVWTIETAEGQALGTVGLHGIDEGQGRTTLGVFIGVKDSWSRGVGTEAIRQTLRYAFGEMALRRVDLQVDEDNARGIRCYEKCGFQREGLLRAFRLRLGEPVSCYSMSVLREDWESQPWR